MSEDDANGPMAQVGAVDDRIPILGDELTARDHVLAEVNRFGSREGTVVGYVNENTLDIGLKSAKDWQRETGYVHACMDQIVGTVEAAAQMKNGSARCYL